MYQVKAHEAHRLAPTELEVDWPDARRRAPALHGLPPDAGHERLAVAVAALEHIIPLGPTHFAFAKSPKKPGQVVQQATSTFSLQAKCRNGQHNLKVIVTVLFPFLAEHAGALRPLSFRQGDQPVSAVDFLLARHMSHARR